MTQDETIKILAWLKSNYRHSFKDMSKQDGIVMLELWTEMFADEPFNLVGTAIKAYISTDKSGYPPNIGTVKDYIRKLTQPAQMTEQEAINRIMKAASNSGYHSVEEFEKLPPVLKQLVGSPSRLREYALMDTNTLNSVVSSNLMRSYKAMQQREAEIQALPNNIKTLIGGLSEKMSIENAKMIEG